MRVYSYECKGCDLRFFVSKKDLDFIARGTAKPIVDCPSCDDILSPDSIATCTLTEVEYAQR